MKLATLLLALVALVAGTSVASAQNGNSTKMEICGQYYNPCCDEMVDLCLKYNFVVSKNGKINHTNVHGSGTGSNGNEYVVSAVGNVKQVVADDGSGSVAITQTENWVAKGNSDCHFQVHYTLRYTVDEDGVVTTNVENVRITCDGAEME